MKYILTTLLLLSASLGFSQKSSWNPPEKELCYLVTCSNVTSVWDSGIIQTDEERSSLHIFGEKFYVHIEGDYAVRRGSITSIVLEDKPLSGFIQVRLTTGEELQMSVQPSDKGFEIAQIEERKDGILLRTFYSGDVAQSNVQKKVSNLLNIQYSPFKLKPFKKRPKPAKE